MKPLYSSTFLSLILALFVFMGAKGYPVVTPGNPDNYSFSNIKEPAPILFSEVGSPVTPESVTIEIFETFKCKECMDFAFDTLKKLQERYQDNEKVILQLYIVPDLNNETENAAAIGVECARDQGKYWEMYYALHKTTEELNTREIDLIGQEMGLEILPFRNCLKSDQHGAKIGENIAYAEEKGIVKKPTILIGDYVLYGNQPIENIEKVIDEILITDN